MRRETSLTFACVVVVLGSPLSSLAQAPVFRSSVDVVRVDALALDGRRPVAGLRAEEFEVLDNGVPQRVAVSPSSEGVNVVLLLDVSGSVVGERFTHLVAAARALVGALRRQDQFSLLTFSHRLSWPARWTADTAEIVGKLPQADPGGRTALYDAVYAGLSVAASHSVGRTLLLVFTDGLDNSSWLTSGQLLGALQRSSSVLYVVTPPDMQTPLGGMASKTGGERYSANADKWLAGVFVRVLDVFRSGYLLTYSPEGVPRGDGWHTLTVRLRGGKGQVRARTGYDSR